MFINPQQLPFPCVPKNPLAPELWGVQLFVEEPRFWDVPHIHFQHFTDFITPQFAGVIPQTVFQQMPTLPMPFADLLSMDVIEQYIAPNGKAG